MKIIIPMAGLGTRFQKAKDRNPEYKKPKPFISVKGHPMVRWATGSLPFIQHPGQEVRSPLKAEPKDLIFIILREHDAEHGIAEKLKEIYSPAITVIVLDHVTRGAAETAYKAKNFIDPEEEIVITDSDHFFDGNHLMVKILGKHKKTVGIIPIFKDRPHDTPKWSYSLINKQGRILKTAEKDRELWLAGAHANIGAYYFSKGKFFLDEVAEVIAKNIMFGSEDKKEFYVAPIYQRLIEKGHRVEAAIVPQVWGLGTPEDLEYFISCGISLK